MTWTWWMTLLVILVVLVLIGCIPVGVAAKYNDDGAYVGAKIWLLTIKLYPGKEGKKKKPKKEKKKKSKQKEPTEVPEERKKSELLSGGVGDILELLDILSDTLGNMRRKLRLNELMLHVTYKGSDPAKAAINYGRAWAVIGFITPQIERLFVIKKRDIQPVLDYNETQFKIDARATLTITVARLLLLAGRAGMKFLSFLISRKKNGKAVQ